MNWKEQQRLFKRAIQDKDLSVNGIFLEKENLSVSLGLKIYQAGFAIRMEEYLLDDFPIVAKILQGKFSSIVKEYAHEYPSSSPTGSDFGEYFAQFLENKKWSPDRAFIPDLAKFEWLLNCVNYSPDIANSGLDRMQSATEEEWLQARLIFDSSICYLESEYPIAAIYQEAKYGGQRSASSLILWREQNEATYRSIGAEEKNIIEALRAGARLQELASRKVELEPSCFEDWICSGILRGIQWK